MRKPGYLTSEFWLVAFTLILTNLGALRVPDKLTWVVNLGLVVGYALSRAIAKLYGPLVVDVPVPVHPAEAATTEEQLRELEEDRKRAEGDKKPARPRKKGRR